MTHQLSAAVAATAAAIILLLGPAALGAQPKQGATQTVSIKNLQFSPATITIKAGDTVVWSNGDDRDHTVVSDDGAFRSGNISSGQSYQYRFTKAGRYAYSCSYHPRMKGVVVVE